MHQEHAPVSETPLPSDTGEQKLAQRTIQQYRKLFRLMIREGQKRRWNGAEEDIYPISDKEIMEDLLENPRRLKFGTLNSMRSAMIYCIRGTVTEHLIEEMQSPDFTAKLKLAALNPLTENSTVRSRPKGRIIPEMDYIQLLSQLGQMKGIARNASVFLQATIATGARPVEWTNATWVDRNAGILRFKTAKSKSVNPFNRNSTVQGIKFKEGDESISYRTVNVEPQHIEIVDKQVLLVRNLLNLSQPGLLAEDMSDDLKYSYFKPYFEKCRVVLHRACMKVFADKRTYSLYDARSTFAANRRALYGVKTAAAELGHNAEKIDQAVQAHYGNRHVAWQSYKKGNPNSQATVRQTYLDSTIPVTYNLPKFGNT